MQDQKDPIKIIQDAQSKGEPVFVLRAQDLLASTAIKHYILECKAWGGIRRGHIAGVQSILKQFEDYTGNLKVPD